LKIVFIIILTLHGLIHFKAFAKAFGYGYNTLTTKEISKPVGTLWL
jgi:hypothetical protein